MTTTRTAHNGSMRLVFDDVGEGPAILLGHSFLCDRTMWAGQVPALAEQYRVLNMDIRGHGESGPADSRCSLAEMVDDALAVLDEAGIERAAWVGLSVGGMIAMRAALDHPERVAALGLLATDAASETGWKRFKYGLLAMIARRVGIRRMVGQINKQMFGKTMLRTRPDIVAHWSRHFAGLDLRSVLNVQPAIVDRDNILQWLPSVEIPAIVLVGQEDAAISPRQSVRLAEALPDVRLQEMEATGHLVAVERPAFVSDALESFLGEVYA